MTQDDIIRMAREAGLLDNGVLRGATDDSVRVERFANLVAAAEREACAKVCEDSVPTYLKDGERWLKGKNGRPDVRLKEIAPNLEDAWEAEQLLKNGSVIESYSVQHKCAAAIRARGAASMNREDIIRMARESCDDDKVDAWGFWTLTQEELERFAEFIAAAEREKYKSKV